MHEIDPETVRRPRLQFTNGRIEDCQDTDDDPDADADSDTDA